MENEDTIKDLKAKLVASGDALIDAYDDIVELKNKLASQSRQLEAARGALRLAGVNETDVLLHDAAVVYETGELCATAWKDAQNLPGPWYVRTASIESYGKSGK